MRSVLFFLTVVYTVLLIIRPQEFLPGLAQTPLLQVILLSAFGIWIASKDKGLELPQFPLLPILLLFIWISMGVGGGWWGGIVSAVDQLLPPMLLMVIVSGSVRSLRQLRLYSWVIMACASALVLHGYQQVTVGEGWTGQKMIDDRIAYIGIFNDPNDMGLLFVLAVALTLYNLHVNNSFILKILLLGLLGWLLYGVYLTDSRGTLLATLMILALEIRAKYGKGVLLLLGAAAVPVLVAFTRLSALDASEESAEGRIDAWYEGLQMLTEHPLFGVGYQNFTDHHNLTAHNSIVLAMAELGVLGYTVWLAIVYFTGWMSWRLAVPRSIGGSVAATAADASERLAARSLLYACCGFATGAFFLSQSFKAMLFLTCGLVIGRYLGMRESRMEVPAFPLLQNMPRIFGWSLLSVPVMWLIVKILL